MWEPISLEELTDQIEKSFVQMDAGERRLWELVRVLPAKWSLYPWGDMGGGFWVVGVIGCNVIWYNDIEDGFNFSRYIDTGIISEYWCNQSELRDVVWSLRRKRPT